VRNVCPPFTLFAPVARNERSRRIRGAVFRRPLRHPFIVRARVTFVSPYLRYLGVGASREGLEDQFRHGWMIRTEEIKREMGGLGSRLHRSEDGSMSMAG